MSLSNCTSIGYIYPDSFCLVVEVDQDQDEFTIDEAWIAGAFFLGLFVGVGIVLLLARPFLAAWEKKKRQDEEKLLEGGGESKIVEAKAVNGWVDDGAVKGGLIIAPAKEKKGLFKGGRFWRKKKESIVEGEPVKEENVDPAVSRGMFNILTKTNSASAEVEMAEQDMSNLVAVERGLDEEKDTLMLRTLALLLKKKMEKRVITQKYFVEFVKKAEEEMKDLNTMIDREKEDAEQKLLNDPKTNKNSQAFETEMEKLQTHYNNKQNKLHKDYRNEIRLNLLRSSGMSEAEVDDLMEKLMKNMAVVEEKIGLEQARQRRALEQRLAKRRQAVEFQEAETKEADANADERVDLLRNLLADHMKDSSMLEKQNDGVIADYANDLDNIRKYFGKEYEGLVLEKFDYLQNTRLNSFFKLNKKQEKEKAAVLQMANKSTPAEFIKVYHDLMVKHHMEQEVLSGELDQKEVQEIHKLKQDISREEAKALDAEAEKVLEKLENTSNMTSLEAQKILKSHKQQMANCNARRQKERQAMMVRLEERLQQRLNAADEAEARDQKEQETLKEEQTATMNKVLATNMDLTEEAKERVLREHEQNMQALSNQLLRSKQRQQKSLEIKLNQRKVRLAELRQKQEDQHQNSSVVKDQDDKNAILAAQIAKEEADFEEARKTAVADLRRRLAEETNQALKLQDEEIGLLIGRLQVGQARRKAILERQDATLKQLQDELEKKVASGETLPTTVTDQIIQQHYNQVSHLNDQIQRRRDEQQRMIMEKLTRKKQHLESEIEAQLEEEAQTEYTDRQQKGAGYASLALMQAFLEQRHSKAMEELQDEMNAELEKGKSDLNMELEQELRNELEGHRQNLLTQLAAVSKMSKADLQEAMTATSHEGARPGSYDNKAAQRLAKDLRNEMERARSSMDRVDNRRDDLGVRRANTDLMSSQGFEPNQKLRKGSATRPPRREAREAFGSYEEEDDNGF
ncbi:myosin-9 isoform X3 [Aplysia californica]|uniref:Myosin-9 isoform X3 n=1 Tax=Aplysia californica TaxID=6500 RepID=A0ABM1A025_APLCA|nr:myosin-9 isoform X3 [Aplysia californica]